MRSYATQLRSGIYFHPKGKTAERVIDIDGYRSVNDRKMRLTDIRYVPLPDLSKEDQSPWPANKVNKSSGQ